MGYALSKHLKHTRFLAIRSFCSDVCLDLACLLNPVSDKVTMLAMMDGVLRSMARDGMTGFNASSLAEQLMLPVSSIRILQANEHLDRCCCRKMHLYRAVNLCVYRSARIALEHSRVKSVLHPSLDSLDEKLTSLMLSAGLSAT